ncbi:hypothetical protein [Clostridium fallax]|uniref:Uncharacterized protein n=1 Tax=Clostridium fallax TaxID=1533 RepID=A0A1M4W8L0_9CLOT|nr:hypothetical protein [Clostridium fallax]SHE77495.1 hypothetical protein SAMN05443638_1116 [Clostridium fallax]SQB05957.1 Uncharacterised protein [Clostridium fallax]
MKKALKSATNNQWVSTVENSNKKCVSSNSKEKTATDNQWTTTLKNDLDVDAE